VYEPHLALDALGRICAATAGCTALFGRDVPLGEALDGAWTRDVDTSPIARAIERLSSGESAVATATDVNGHLLAAELRHMAHGGNQDDTVLVSFRPAKETT
jgi:hypothetical protein